RHTRFSRDWSSDVCSSDLVYRNMDIGTGKDLEEYRNIPYHLINIKNPGDKYNVDLFRQDFFKAYDHIINAQKQPILCGGSGSYKIGRASCRVSELRVQNYA